MKTKEETLLHQVKVADEVWIATALLHRENPERQEFTIKEVVERARQENVYGRLRPGVQVHATLHSVANKAPNPGGYIMLFATGKHTRRLFRPGDPVHPRRNGKVMPKREEIAEQYHGLLDWYQTEYAAASLARPHSVDAILSLRGLGKEIWQDEDPDEYVRRLREGWD